MDTLTGQDTQSVTLSAHLKLSGTNLRGPIATRPTLSGFLLRGVRRGLSQSCCESGRGCVVGTLLEAHDGANRLVTMPSNPIG